MKILVTGGIGRIGRVTVKRLLEHKHDVIAADRLPETELDDDQLADIEGAQYAQIDITDYDSLRPHFEGMDAIIHLAAYAHPGMGAGNVIFTNNAGGAFSVYQAAADAGIKRVVSASSINALGFNFGVKPSTIQYLPMDEDHPCVTTDAYSFSKIILEQIADYFWRREGISGVCLRFPSVRIEGWSPFRRNAEWAQRREASRIRTQQDFEALLAMRETERKAHVLRLIANYDLKRKERPNEIPFEQLRQRWQNRPSPEDLAVGESLIQRRTNFWTVLDGRDAAQALEKGVTAEYEGSHPLYVNAAENILGFPSQQLAEIAFPEVSHYTRQLQGTEALVSINKARALIGFEPDYMTDTMF